MILSLRKKCTLLSEALDRLFQLSIEMNKPYKVKQWQVEGEVSQADNWWQVIDCG